MRKTTAEKIAKVQKQKQQIENEMKRLQQQQRAEDKKARNHRICRRGAHIESLINGASEMTDEQFYKAITNALSRANVQPPAKKAAHFPAPKPSESGDNTETVEFA